MKKQGFTLIELMVVIVIMGILAAVAVPKLFGMIAKSKASEVGPAAGEYIKLQEAFISETNTAIGSWKAIGYTAPGTTTNTAIEGGGEANTGAFEYHEPKSDYSSDRGSAELQANQFVEVWQAENKADLNDCTKGINWGLQVAVGSAGGSWKTKNLSGNCVAVTPQFGALGTATY